EAIGKTQRSAAERARGKAQLHRAGEERDLGGRERKFEQDRRHHGGGREPQRQGRDFAERQKTDRDELHALSCHALRLIIVPVLVWLSRRALAMKKVAARRARISRNHGPARCDGQHTSAPTYLVVGLKTQVSNGGQ